MAIQKQKFPVGMVFGVFDGFHEGHQHFLAEALTHCQELIVVVAHPDMVTALKRRPPQRPLVERIEAIRSLVGPLTIVPGDIEIGTWSALREFQPNIILLGYDQTLLGQELARLAIPHVFLTPHFPEKFKSSLLDKERPV